MTEASEAMRHGSTRAALHQQRLDIKAGDRPRTMALERVRHWARTNGAAMMTAEMVSFKPGGHTALHQHPVPSFVHVLEGQLEVRVKGQEPMRFTVGQAFVEPQNINMQAFNVADGPTKLLVVYSGTEGGKNMVVTQ